MLDTLWLSISSSINVHAFGQDLSRIVRLHLLQARCLYL